MEAYNYPLGKEVRTVHKSWRQRTIEEGRMPPLPAWAHGILSDLWYPVVCMNYTLVSSPSHPIPWHPAFTKTVTLFAICSLFLSPDTDNQLFELGCEELGWCGGPDGRSEESEQFPDYGVWELWRHHGYCSEYYGVSPKWLLKNISCVSGTLSFLLLFSISIARESSLILTLPDKVQLHLKRCDYLGLKKS